MKQKPKRARKGKSSKRPAAYEDHGSWSVGQPAPEKVSSAIVVKLVEALAPFISTARRTRDGMAKGRTRRQKDAEAKARALEEFFNAKRKRYPKLGINAMILAAVKERGAKRSTIQDYRRRGLLTIPPAID